MQERPLWEIADTTTSASSILYASYAPVLTAAFRPTHSYRCCHVVDTQLGTVSPHHPKVNTIENKSNPGLHHSVRLERQQEAHSGKEEQQCEVAGDANSVGTLVDQEEPPVHQPGGRSYAIMKMALANAGYQFRKHVLKLNNRHTRTLTLLYNRMTVS